MRQPTPSGGAILIPAHNEAAVIDRTLKRLSPIAEDGNVEICVICNGCTDDTAERARRHRGVKVLEIEPASKIAALNAGDAWATRWPRMYLDADIDIEPDAVRHVFEVLDGPAAAARPLYRYDTSGASALVRAYYRARKRMPSTRLALWGAGVYALSEVGHARFDRFPPVTADDLYVDRLFSASEKHIVPTVPVKVRTPRTTPALLAILRRNQRGVGEFDGSSAGTSLRELLLSVRGASSAIDAIAYAALAALSRVPLLRPGPSAWERDSSSRQAL